VGPKHLDFLCALFGRCPDFVHQGKGSSSHQAATGPIVGQQCRRRFARRALQNCEAFEYLGHRVGREGRVDEPNASVDPLVPVLELFFVAHERVGVRVPPPSRRHNQPSLGFVVVHKAERKSYVELVFVVALGEQAERGEARRMFDRCAEARPEPPSGLDFAVGRPRIMVRPYGRARREIGLALDEACDQKARVVVLLVRGENEVVENFAA
jgi:hypothetical protein